MFSLFGFERGDFINIQSSFTSNVGTSGGVAGDVGDTVRIYTNARITDLLNVIPPRPSWQPVLQ